MSLSTSQVIAVASSICSGVAIIVGDLSQAALVPSHVVAVVLAVTSAIATVISTVTAVETETKS